MKNIIKQILFLGVLTLGACESNNYQCIRINHIGLRESIKYEYLITDSDDFSCAGDTSSFDYMWIEKHVVSSEVFEDLLSFFETNDTSDDYDKNCLVGGYKIEFLTVEGNVKKEIYVAGKKSYDKVFDGLWNEFSEVDREMVDMLQGQIQRKFFGLSCK